MNEGSSLSFYRYYDKERPELQIRKLDTYNRLSKLETDYLPVDDGLHPRVFMRLGKSN
jgi:hypothetical protein